MASNLIYRLVEDVLFLKGQIALPVAHLSKLSEREKVPAKIDKKRTALLDELDLLSAHLSTTFPALSSALGALSTLSTPKHATAHVMIIVGPTITTPKARILCAIDGLEVIPPPAETCGEEGDSEDEDSDEDDESDETSEDESEESEGAHPPPASPTPTSPRPPSPISQPLPLLSSSPPPHPPSMSSNPSLNTQDTPTRSHPIHADQSYHRAQRLLSKTLSTSESLRDIVSEITPTQTRILLRAPRSFSHPTWHPLQSHSASFDKHLEALVPPPPPPPSALGSTATHLSRTKKPGFGRVKTEVIRITCSGVEDRANSDRDDEDRAQTRDPGQDKAEAELSRRLEEVCITDRGRDGTDDDADDAEADDGEMIWWCWEGKLIGFADW
ncbi:hypothetical protein SISNIDRAFT_518230 [Sistotremastrum niveocremeum HHB9708]|uniref:Uncharacterized protein n=1 Tax=Sistotremastrum niveocremeum HHB9708 TaxID=1314777 RepID=A0A164RTP9_9AGAM|nr:hypothetical protein SISNIDRAFT_518230 [Sistotremastrum niveocremeum HHB9708]